MQKLLINWVKKLASGFIVISSLLTGLSGCSNTSASSLNDPQPTVNSTSSQSWILLFSDEFDGFSLDRNRWQTTYPFGRRTTHSNDERQWYDDTEPFRLENSCLHITASRRSMEGNSAPSKSEGADPALPDDEPALRKHYAYQSGLISSFDSFQVAPAKNKPVFIEMRAKLPQGRGLWPAFWMIPANNQWPPEIDIMEYLGHEPHTLHFSHHWGNRPEEHAMEHFEYSDSSITPSVTEGFHTYGVRWATNSITWYFDGVQRHQSKAHIPQIPFYILANLAVGGEQSWPGAPDTATRFPATYTIDYIRAWQQQ